MSPQRDAPGPPAGAPAFLVPILLGLAAGLGIPAWTYGLRTMFGTAVDGELTLLAVAGAAVAIGLRRGIATPRGLAIAGATSGLVTAAVATAPAWGAQLQGRLGASLDPLAPVAIFTRVLLGAAFLAPAGLAAGGMTRRLVRTAPAGAVALGAGAGAWSLAGAAALAYGNVLAPQAPGLVAAIALAAAGLLAAGTARSGRAPGPDPGNDPDAPHATAAAILAGAAVAAAVVGFFRLADRVMVPVFGNALPGVPLTAMLFALGLALGVTAGLLAARRLPGRGIALAPAPLLAVAAAFAVLVVGRFDALPAQFVARIDGTTGFDAVLGAARHVAWLRCGGMGALLGLPLAMLVAALPARAAERPAWLARVGTGAALGAFAGAAAALLSIAPLGIPGALALVAAGAVLPAAIAAWLTPLPAAARAMSSVVALGLVAAAIVGAPSVDRGALLIDAPKRAPRTALVRHWTAYDRAGPRMDVHVRSRGHERQLLVDGCFEMSGMPVEKSHGILAHLPLTLLGGRGRALVVGAGTGWTIASVGAHPVESLDCFERSPELVEAAASFGPGSRRAMELEQLQLHLGDPADLLSRAQPFDAILLQPSGAWTGRSAAVCTSEFLALARARLRDGGFVAQWVPGDALTKEGLLVLLATYCASFPQVEVWAGQGGDLIVLAGVTRGPHDFARMATAYGNVVASRAIAASWIETPQTLLSQFLLDDATTRKLAANHAVHTVANGELTRKEAARRTTSPTVDPVPGLVALRGDVLAQFTNLPADHAFANAVGDAIRARDRERDAIRLEAQRNTFDAADVYREAIRLNPHDRSVRRGFATMRSEQGVRYARKDEFTAAYGYMLEAVQTDTTYVNGFANLGRLLSDMKNYDYAISALRQAAALAPEDDLIYFEIGRAWRRRGYVDKALPFYERAMELNPRNVEAAVEYVDSRIIMEGDHPDFHAAIDMLERYRKFAPDDEELLERIRRFRSGLSPDAPDPHEGHDHGPLPGAPSFDDGADAPADSG
jgi:predicted membrane-bound spermidine synthase